MRRILILVVALVVAAVGLLQMRDGLYKMFPSWAADREVRTASSDAVKAADDFTALAKGSAQSGSAPRETDPAAKPLLDRVFGTGALASKTLTEADLSSASDWNLAVARTGLVYIFAGTGVSDPSKVTNDPKLIERVNQNVVTFAPEMGRYLDAQIALTGATIDAVNASIGSGKPANAQVEHGLESVRGGVTSTLAGALSTLTTEGLSDDWRHARLTALGDVSPKAGKLLLPDQCRTLRDAASQAAEAIHDATTQDVLKRFETALNCAA